MFFKIYFNIFILISLACTSLLVLYYSSLSLSVMIFYCSVISYLYYLKNTTKDLFTHPLFLFSATYVFLILSSYSIRTTPSEVLLLYFTCFYGYISGWHCVDTRVVFSIRKIRFPFFNHTAIIIFCILCLIIAFQIQTAIYIVLVFSHVALCTYLMKSGSVAKWLYGLIVVYFSFLLGKVIILRLFILIFFWDRVWRGNKRSSFQLLFAVAVMLVLFTLFNYRRFLLEGNVDYINLGIFAILNAEIVSKLLIAGSDYFWSLDKLLQGPWIEFGSYGTTYLSAIMKFFPQSFFIFRPDSANVVMNSYIFDGYVKNSYTMATTFVGELYINFGIFACFGAFLLGLFMKQVYLLVELLERQTENGWLYSGSFFALQFSLARDDFNVSFGTFLLYALVIYLITQAKTKE